MSRKREICLITLQRNINLCKERLPLFEKGSKAELDWRTLCNFLSILSDDLRSGDPDIEWKAMDIEWPPVNEWEVHTRFPTEAWMADAAHDSTRLGYVDWVSHQLEKEKAKFAVQDDYQL